MLREAVEGRAELAVGRSGPCECYFVSFCGQLCSAKMQWVVVLESAELHQLLCQMCSSLQWVGVVLVSATVGNHQLCSYALLNMSVCYGMGTA